MDVAELLPDADVNALLAYAAVLLANDSFGHTALESLPYAALTLFAQLEVLTRMGQMAFESFTYVELRVTTVLLANVADDAVALRDVSVNVDALITMLDDA